MEKITFDSSDGVKLAGVWHIPSSPTSKTIVLAHGLTVDKDEDGIFVDIANLLAENGFAVFRFDFRGHGESEGKQEDMTIAGELMDLDAAVDEVQNKGFTKVGLLGASFGGGIATLYAAENPDKIKALCLWNPCLNYDHIFINPITPWLKDKKEKIKTQLEEKGWAEVGSRNFKLGKALFDEMSSTFPFEEMKKIKIPTIIIHPDKDSYVPYEDSVNYLNNLQGERRLVTIGGGDHGFHDKHKGEAIAATVEFFKKNL